MNMLKINTLIKLSVPIFSYFVPIFILKIGMAQKKTAFKPFLP
ncbi:hypothetical protein HNR69_001332 [Histophilus somni]|nr:hypothetical protein [Histophilus somni]